MKKTIALLLTLALLCVSAVACGDNGENGSDAETASQSGEQVSSAEESGSGDNSDYIKIFKDSGRADYDMEGREFYIMQRWFGYANPTLDFQGEVIWADPEDGQLTSINRAKQRVLQEVQTLYNCTVTGEISTGDAAAVREMISTDLLSQIYEFDFCFETPYYYSGWIEEGMLVDLNTLDIDFKQPWWDQNGVKDLSICGSTYFALGDINTYDNDGTFVMLINKNLYDELKESSYKELFVKAKNREWTFDDLKSEIKGVAYDITGDNVIDEFDRWGLLTETANLYMHVIAAGEKIADKNANDEPVITMLTTRTYESLISAVELYLTQDVLIANTEPYLSKYPEGNTVYEHTVTNAFQQGRGLFYLSGLLHVPYFRNMDDEFGVLPVPMYDLEQGEYTHETSVHNMSTVFVPAGENAEGQEGKEIGMLLDALGAYSKQYLTPEYYEKQLKYRDFKDEDSAEMLDIIFETRAFDLGAIFGTAWNNAFTLYETLDTNVESRFKAQVDLITAKMERTIGSIKEAQAEAAAK